MKNYFACLILGLIILEGCQSKAEETSKEDVPQKTTLVNAVAKETEVQKVTNDAATILSKKEVPILCYHNIKNFDANAGPMTKVYSVKPANFAEQMKALSDAGYHSILPDQLYEYLVHDAPLPSKPVMITFDDTRGEQFSIGAAEMNKYGFKGVFFVMTVSINRPNYLTAEEIKKLSDDGHVVGAHTWDHHMVTKYSGDDWNTQLVKPKKKLEDIIGKPVTYFAYPFGLWNKEAIPKVKESGYEMAFILSTKRDSIDPLYTIRRMIVSGTWNTEGMMRSTESTFKK
ncbi:polysaccharide deacetylase family protein [Flavobacterium degerlachei]|jgi:peptidoglycan/xylan/chitin deacetylase (PgdA/CDA1 family)|uniref:Polysaccharide deacetylase n=1 Tax=Flavobacterium degerlachei TaxID=229203 RepID=A0A1H2R359_9FLAO|nr:polysaccharide deacetylase family protein [Flavobacterium degerlachei]SDW13791.1 Polysaccharide deacetylase [Flavobacterium degerlachei]